MNELLLIMVEAGGIFAPSAFILFHLLRSFLFILYRLSSFLEEFYLERCGERYILLLG